jgi:putative transposase
MQRTVRVLLQPTAEQGGLLAETARQFTAVINGVTAYGWAHHERNGVALHHATYHPLKLDFPSLVSDHHIQARVKATEAVKSALTRAKQGRKTRCPQSAWCPPRYNVHTFTLNWADGIANLATTGGRQRIPFRVPDYVRQYVGADVATADLMHRDGRWWLHVVVTLPAPPTEPIATVVGVDLGLAQAAVTSNNRFLGQPAWRNIEAKRFKLRRALQAKGTKAAKRHLQRLRRAQARFRRDCDHVLSKQIVAATPPGGTLAVENLTDIRSRVKPRHGAQARRLHAWSFAQLRGFIAYKAEAKGCTVVGVDPRHTSQACSRCGHVARNNRRSRAWFQCRQCLFQTHADRNGALNIAARARASGSMSAASEPPVNRLIVGDACSQASTHKPSPVGAGR